MNGKHTPGKWEYCRMHIGPKAKNRRCGFVVNGPEVNGEGLPTRVCDLRVPAGISGYSEGEANARLIAAAPSLLEALNDFYVWLQSPSVDSATLAFMQEKASRAIASAATGEG